MPSRSPIPYTEMIFACVHPDSTLNSVIHPASAFVLFPAHLTHSNCIETTFDPLQEPQDTTAAAGPFLAYYEGNIYGAQNMQYFHDKVYHAANRAHTRYPTTSMMMLPNLDSLIVLGSLDTQGYPRFDAPLSPTNSTLVQEVLGADLDTLKHQVHQHLDQKQKLQNMHKLMCMGR